MPSARASSTRSRDDEAMKTILAVTLMNLRNIPSRLGTSLVIVVGIAGVVGVLIGMLSMTKGFERTLKGTGTDARALILSAGSTSELPSYVTPDMANLVTHLAALAHGADGK